MDTTLVGGAGADTYSATQATLTAGDVLSGSTGNDTLSISSTGGDLGAGVISRLVENIRVTATGATTVNGAQFDDVTTVENSGSTAASTVTFTNLKAIPTINLNGTNSSTSVGVAASVVAGTSDAATVNLTSAANSSSVTLTANGIETINVVASGASGAQDTTGDITAGRTVTVASNTLTTLAVTGTGTARIYADLVRATDTITGTVTSDAGSHNVEVKADSGDKVSVAMGAGDDSVRIEAIGTLTGSSTVSGWTVSGGEGNDTLIMSTGSTSITGANLADFEAVRLTGGSTVWVDQAKNNVTSVTFDANSGSFTGLKSGGTVNARVGGTITVANTDVSTTGWQATTATTDSLTVNSGTTSAGATSNLSLTAAGVETITINNLGAPGDTTARTNTVNGSTVKTLTVSAPGALTLNASSATALTSVTASAVVGDLTFTSAATAGASVTGGAGNDVLGGGTGADSIDAGAGNDSISGGAGADTLTGGAGADTITGGTGADVLTGGDGADRFVFASNDTTAATPVATSTLGAQDTIKDFVSGTDKIQITGTYAPVAFLGNFTNIQAALAANNADGVLAKSAAFVTGENALYVFNAKGTTLNVDDMVIKLEGVTSLAAGDLLLGSQGSGNFITIAAAGADIKASGSTGGTVTATKVNTPDGSINTTDANDTVTVSTLAAVAATTSVSAGAGTDELILTIAATSGADGQATDTELANFTGFETITLANRSNSTTAGDVNWDVKIHANNVAANSTLTIVSLEDGVQADGSVGTVKISAANLTANGKRVNITGGDAHDLITGGDYNDTISGGAGNDTITGGTGNDSLSGGAGNDTFVLGGTANTVTTTISGGGQSADTLQIIGAVTADLSKVSLSGLKVLNSVAAETDAQLVTLTASQLALFSSIDMVGGTDVITVVNDPNVTTATTFTLPATIANTESFVVGTAGSTLRGTAAQLTALTVTGTAVGGGDTLDLTGSADFDAATGVTKFQTITYTGNSDKTMSVATANLFYGNGAADGNTGARVITGSGTSNLTIAGVANANTVSLQKVALTGFDLITFTTDDTGDVLAFDPADVSGATLTSAGTAVTGNLTVINTLAAAGTLNQDLSTTTITASKFDTLSFGSNTASYVTNLTVSEKAMVTGLANVLGTTNGTENLIVTASSAAAAVSLVAVTTTTGVDTIKINGGSGNNTITVAAADDTRAITTVDISQGGSDTIVINNAATGANINKAVTIDGFTAGNGVGADTITLQINGTAPTQGQIISSADATVATDGRVLIVASAVQTLSDFTATANNGAVEAAIANAVGTHTANTGVHYIVFYGGGANSGKAAIYMFTTDANSSAVGLANVTGLELVGVLNGVAADALVLGNFI